MNWGCLSFIILFPVGIFIWAAGERQRRAALPLEELKKLEAEEDFGPIDEKLKCIFCHSKNCVREKISLEDLVYENSHRSYQEWANLKTVPQKEIFNAHCMNCGNSWQRFALEEKTPQ